MASAADADNPWPGLATFTEDQAGLFHGRDTEIRDLARRAERNALTVLFGQSGLGKSSLLQAGVFPRLRAASFWPIYIRLDHGPGAPAPSEQVKAVVLADTVRAGTWTKPGSAKAGETLWEFFHHRDDRLVGANGRTIVPVLVFDQFEELFTLGAGGGAERARAVAFMSELAELVENRPSEQLVARLEESSAEMDAFDFSRTDYRVVISLREDFLPHLESLKTIMPALMENRMRLARMTGTQALEAVVKPGRTLVTEDVARAIVEFVAGARGGSVERLAELDVEPPLLSVICRELNERRRALGQPQITADLVSGNRREILTDFYDRSVRDLPEAMRAFVEDRLLTKSGFRDNLALESALESPGVTPSLIDTLVARRLVRLEDRLGVQRVELTHDVLAEVIRASRDERQQRLAVEQVRQREQITRRRMWLARGIAAALLVGLAGVSWIAWRAIRAERAQEQMRQRESVLRREAETRQRAEARRWSRSDTVAASRFFEEGKTQDGLAYLVHAARIDPDNPVVALRLMSALANRSFVRPYGATIQLPVGIQRGGSQFLQAIFTRDGQSVGVWGNDGIYRLVDFASGRIERELPLGAKVVAVSLRADSIITFAPDVPAVSFYDLATGALWGTWPVAGSWATFDLSDDGRRAAFMPNKNTILIWDVMAGRVEAKLSLPDGIASGGAWALNRNGTRLASITERREKAQVWSVPEGRLLAEVPAPEGSPKFNRVFFSHNGRLIVIGSDRGGGRFYDAATGQPMGPWMTHGVESGWSTWPRFTLDDALFVTAAADRTARVWNVRTGQLVFPPLVHGGAVQGLGVFCDGRVLATFAGDGFTRFWDLTTGRLLVEPFKQLGVSQVRMAQVGKNLMEVNAEGKLRRLGMEPNAARPLTLPLVDGELGWADWVPDEPATLARVTEQRLTHFDAATGREVAGGFEFPEPIQGYSRSANGRVMLVTTRQGARQAWTLGPRGPRVVRLQNVPEGEDVRFNVNADGSMAVVIAGLDAKEMRVWDLRTGQPVAPAMQYSAALFGSDSNGSFSPDSKWVAAGSMGGEAKVWEVAMGRLVHDLKPLRGKVRRVEFSPDGKRIATVEFSGGSKGARLWDAVAGQPISPPLEHSGAYAGMTPGGFSKDGRWLVTYAQVAGSVVVWDGHTGARVGAQLEHSARIRLPVFSPDGAQLLTGCFDGAARLWDTRTGQLIAEPMRHGEEVRRVSFSPDGRFILTQGERIAGRIWAAPPAAAARAPEWLLRLATLHAGTLVNDDGNTVDASGAGTQWEQLRAEVTALPAGAPFGAWGRWLVAEPEKRTLAPGFAITLAEAEARGLIAEPATAAPAEEEPADTSSLLR